MNRIKQNKILTGTFVFIFVGIISIIYAIFTSNLNISGTGINRKSNFDIYFDNVSDFQTTGTASVTPTSPTSKNHTTIIEDYDATFINPGDSISFTFDVVNDGDYDVVLESLRKGPLKCSVNGDENNASAKSVCNNIIYEIQYTDINTYVKVRDVIASKETRKMRAILTYSSKIEASQLPSSDVSISNLGIDMIYKACEGAKTNVDGSTPYQKPTAVSLLLSKANDESVKTYQRYAEYSQQMYTFSHPATEQTEALTDYRYRGINPNNYVNFNCDDNGNNCETWRIIGVFTVKNGDKEEQRIKLVRKESIGRIAWDSTSPLENEWPSATLYTYLNGEYYDSLSDSAKSVIEPAETYLGGSIYDSTTHYGTADDVYAWERGTTRSDESRSIKTTNNVTLIYPSDVAYAIANEENDICYNDIYSCQGNKSFISQSWTVSSPAEVSNSSKAFWWPASFGLYKLNVASKDEVHPVVYLKSDVSFEGDHSGTEYDRYKLKY